ncbi:MAG: TIGR01777 family protein, partial [Candidatus Rokubacteria bacterium]|nr:TIGR01777 family protein [Candidatus Rokubacteria bacterium]
MHVLVTGSTGLIGSTLVPFLTAAGHRVTRLVRPASGPPEPTARAWDPAKGLLNAADLEGVDAAVHLAGENLASGRWTAPRKARIRASRVGSTALLCDTLAGLAAPARVLVCASAVGYYGSRGDEVLREESGPGTGFLAEVCRAWEAATAPAARRGIRVVHTRFGVILTPAGGALATMLLPFRLGLGGRLGSGAQYWSWITLDDVVSAIAHAIATDGLAGPVNVVAPTPVTNGEFTATLGRVLGRPTLFPVPAFALRLLLGDMARELLLASA